MKDVERERFHVEATALAERLRQAISSAGSGPTDQAIWQVYAGTEKLIALLKLRLDYETPGVFTDLPDASDQAKLLAHADGALSMGADEIGAGKLIQAIETLRKARNDLRSYLTARRRRSTIRRPRPRSR